MNKQIIQLGGSFLTGMIIIGVLGWNMMPSMMLHEVQSPYNLTETVAKIKSNTLAGGWVIPSIKPLHKSVKKHGGGDLRPIMLVNICQAHHAYSVLKNESDRRLSVFMPCTISVYEKDDGKTYIATMNAGLLGKMFGGNVAVVMKDVATDQQSFIAFANK